MQQVRKAAQHYCRHEWTWLNWLGLLALVILAIGLFCK